MFRLAGLGDDIDRLIEYLDDHGDEVRTKEDIPCDQVNVIASVIKVQNHVNSIICSNISDHYLFLFSIPSILAN